MDAELFEDLTRKEDQSRLNRCTELFASLSADDVESHLSDILSYLHDTWSVIRSECGKQLSKKSSLFSEGFVSSLLAGCKNSTQWQEIHGSILGLSALLSVVKNSNDQTILDDISELCLSLIGHVNIPVKESARSCLINIQKQRHDKNILLHKIVALVSSVAQSTHSDTEASALQLDGLLGCLADTYQLFPELVLPSEHQNGEKNEGSVNSGDSALEVAKTIRICALHPASTVRQKAGQIITLFMLTFLRLPVLQVPVVVKYITNMLTEALCSGGGSGGGGGISGGSDVWCLQEISLMVSEEIVRVVVEIQLEVLGNSNTGLNNTGTSTATNNNTASNTNANFCTNTNTNTNTNNAPSAMLTHTYSYLNFLKNHLSVLLGHTQFEVRRMTVQLLPLLARAFVLLNASFGALSGGDSADCTDTRCVDMRIVADSSIESTGGVGGVGGVDSGVERVGSSEEVDFSRLNSTSVDASDADCDDIYINRMSTCSDISDTHNTTHNTIHDITDTHHANLNLNTSFRSVHSTHTTHSHSHHTHTLDIQHITQMVWLSELIKENQHLFESYTLDDAWASSGVTSTLQMRSHSIKDSELHRQFAEYAVHTSNITTSTSTNTTNTTNTTTNTTHTPSHYTPGGAISKLVSGKHSFYNNNTSTNTNTNNTTNNTSTNNTTTTPYTRGVVDHWSLDVRGRLTEIEKRTQFHRTVRTLVNTEIVNESSSVCYLLLQNCKSVLAMCESMVYTWENALKSSDVNFMSTLHSTMNSVHHTPLNTSITNTTNVTLSIDLIECFALIDTFLLSVTYRFTHCPDIQSVLSNLSNAFDPEVELLQSAAQLLRDRLCMLYPDVVRYIARIQCIGRGSVHVGARSGVSGCTVGRVTASQELLGVYSVYGGTSSSDSGGGVKGGLFADAIESDVDNSGGVYVSVGGASSKNNSNILLSERAIVDILLAYVHGKITSADNKDTTHASTANTGSIVSMEDVVRDMYADKVALIGSLTNTTVSLGSYGTHVHNTTHTNTANTANTNTNTNATSSNTNDVLHSPSKVPTSTHNTPLTRHLHTPHSQHSPSRHTTHTTKYLSLDQWNCETVSPLLTCIAHATSDPRSALQFSAIVVEWCVACVMNPLWLDSRHNAKKNLFESLVLLLATAEQGDNVDSVGGNNDSSDSVYILVVFRVLRAVVELLSLRSAKPLLELKLLMCSIKAAISAVRLCMRYQHTLHEVFVSCAATHSDSVDVYVQGWNDLCSIEITPLISECIVHIDQSWEYYTDIYPLPTVHTHTHTTHTTDTTDNTSESDSASTSSSDEFSDWDEESDESVPDTTTNDNNPFNVSGSVNTLLPVLYEDVEVLKGLLRDWTAL